MAVASAGVSIEPVAIGATNRSSPATGPLTSQQQSAAALTGIWLQRSEESCSAERSGARRAEVGCLAGQLVACL